MPQIEISRPSSLKGGPNELELKICVYALADAPDPPFLASSESRAADPPVSPKAALEASSSESPEDCRSRSFDAAAASI